MEHGREVKYPRWRDGRHAREGAWREQYNARVTRVFGEIGVSVDLPRVHSHRLRRDAEAHMLGEFRMRLFIVLRRLWPPHYGSRGEGPARERDEEHGVPSAGGCSLRKDPADAPVGGAVTESTY